MYQLERRSFAGAQDDKGALRMIGTVWLKRAEGSALDVRNVICKTDEEGLGGGAWKTRGRPWPRERVDGACARRDGAKRKVFQVPPSNSGSWNRQWRRWLQMLRVFHVER